MAATGEQVFDIAVVLMDEVGDTGIAVDSENIYYKNKTPQILTVLQTELLPSTTTPTVISDLTQNLLIDDRTALKVLPYGLAAHLALLDGNDIVASYFNARYDELKKKRPASITAITDVYNVLGGMQ